MGKCCQLISALCSGRDMSESKDGQSEYVKYAVTTNAKVAVAMALVVLLVVSLCNVVRKKKEA